MSSFVRIVEKVFNIKLDDNSIDDKDKSFQQIVIDYGYEIEEHTVETEDKYTLQIFHLINKNKINSLTAIPLYSRIPLCQHLIPKPCLQTFQSHLSLSNRRYQQKVHIHL